MNTTENKPQPSLTLSAQIFFALRIDAGRVDQQARRLFHPPAFASLVQSLLTARAAARVSRPIFKRFQVFWSLL
jgi:hypothetical protein